MRKLFGQYVSDEELSINNINESKAFHLYFRSLVPESIWPLSEYEKEAMNKIHKTSGDVLKNTRVKGNEENQ